MESDASPPLPPFNYHGYLPEGVHDTSLCELRTRLVINPKRTMLWERLQEFLQWAVATGAFSHAYIDGGFITNKSQPEDIDVILQTRARYGAEAFAAMEPFFVMGLDAIYTKYSVHLHFGARDFPAA